MNLDERLKYARQAMNLTLAEVEKSTGIGSSTLSDFENGKREPRLPQLKQLAEVYRRSTSFFLEEGAIPPEVVLWRQRPTSPHVENLQAQLLRLAEQYHNLERWCDDVEELELPFAKMTSEQFGYSQAEKLAHEFRTRFGLGERPGVSLLRIVEEVCKVKVFQMEFEPTGSAACSYSERFGAAILLNSKNVRWRRNFDLAHELFHLLTWKVFRTEADSTASIPAEKEEKLATCFARNLLMPQEPFRIAIDSQLDDKSKLNFEALFEVARQFDVSVESVLWQMKLVYKLSQQAVEEGIAKWRSNITFWEKRQVDSPPSRPLRFEALAKQALRQGSLSTGRYAEYLGISRREAMHQFEQEAPDDAEIEVINS